MFCRKCGHELNGSEKKCAECGHEEKDTIIIKGIVKEKISNLISFIKTKKKIMTCIIGVICGLMLFSNFNSPDKAAKKFVKHIMKEEMSQVIEMLDADHYVSNGIVNKIVYAGERATSIHAKNIYKENKLTYVRVTLSGKKEILGIIDIALIKSKGKWNVVTAEDGSL